jgi:hypothetical protein
MFDLNSEFGVTSSSKIAIKRPLEVAVEIEHDSTQEAVVTAHANHQPSLVGSANATIDPSNVKPDRIKVQAGQLSVSEFGRKSGQFGQSNGSLHCHQANGQFAQTKLQLESTSSAKMSESDFMRGVRPCSAFPSAALKRMTAESTIPENGFKKRKVYSEKSIQTDDDPSLY